MLNNSKSRDESLEGNWSSMVKYFNKKRSERENSSAQWTCGVLRNIFISLEHDRLPNITGLTGTFPRNSGSTQAFRILQHNTVHVSIPYETRKYDYTRRGVQVEV